MIRVIICVALVFILMSSGNKNIAQENKLYEKVDVMPEYPGGTDALMKFLIANVKYPEKAKESKTEGKVLVQFVVEKNGEVSNIEILEGVTKELDLEAIRVSKLMPKWNPGKKDGNTVRVKMVLPFKFKLA